MLVTFKVEHIKILFREGVPCIYSIQYSLSEFWFKKSIQEYLWFRVYQLVVV